MPQIIMMMVLITAMPMVAFAADRQGDDRPHRTAFRSSGHGAEDANERSRSRHHDKKRHEDRFPQLTVPSAVSVEATGPLTTVSLGTAIATDEDGRSLPVSNDAPASFPVGSTIVTYKATGEDRRTATGTQVVTVVDTTAPTIVIQQPAITVEATSLSMTVDLGTVTATDLVDGLVVPVNNAPASFGLGVTPIDWTATDAAGNTATAQQLVTVQDTTPPVLSAPAAVSTNSSTGQPIAVSIGMATATDLFGPVSVTNNAPANFPVGRTMVTWTATDAHGNSATAMQAVTVNDTSFLANLPPDPGAAGEATLAGIDSDHDGVRDDVQRWIAINYPNSQKIRAALTQKTKTMQLFLLDASNPAKAYNISVQMGKDTDCVAYILSSGFSKITSAHRAVFLNTDLRTRAWLKADHMLSGKMFSDLPYSQWRQGCNFNPYAMPN